MERAHDFVEIIKKWYQTLLPDRYQVRENEIGVHVFITLPPEVEVLCVFTTLRAKLGSTLYCNRSCLWDCLCVCLWVCYHDNSKLCTPILAKLGW